MDWELSIKHLFCGFIPVLALLVLYYIVLYLMKKKQNISHIIVSIIFAFYLIGILTMTGVWFMHSLSPTIVYVPFVDMIGGPVDTVLNIILFLPLGFFLPLLYVKFDSVKKVAIVGFLLSLSVEIVQMFGTGATDINDLITNTLGACLGYGIFRLANKAIPKSWIDKIRVKGSQCYYELLLFWLGSLLIMVFVQPIIYHAFFTTSTTGGEIQQW